MSKSTKLPRLPDILWIEIIENFDHCTQNRLLTLDQLTHKQILIQLTKFFKSPSELTEPTFFTQTLPKIGHLIQNFQVSEQLPYTMLNYCPNLKSFTHKHDVTIIQLARFINMYSDLQKLISLDFENCLMLNEFLSEVGKLSFLKELKLPLSILESETIITFLELCKFNKLMEFRLVVGEFNLEIVELMAKKLPYLKTLELYYDTSNINTLSAFFNSKFEDLEKLLLYSLETITQPLNITLSKLCIPKLKSIDTNLQLNFAIEKNEVGNSIIWPLERRAKLTSESYSSDFVNFSSKLTHLVLGAYEWPLDLCALSTLSQKTTLYLKSLELLSFNSRDMMSHISSPMMALQQLNIKIKEQPDLKFLIWISQIAPKLLSLNVVMAQADMSYSTTKDNNLYNVTMSHLIQFSYYGDGFDVSFLKDVIIICPNLSLIITLDLNPFNELGFDLPDNIEYRAQGNLDHLWSNYFKIENHNDDDDQMTSFGLDDYDDDGLVSRYYDSGDASLHSIDGEYHNQSPTREWPDDEDYSNNNSEADYTWIF